MTNRRVGAETSKTRDQLLDCVERLMLSKGYAAVTYRAVAAAGDVTSGLVQYYFPTLDDLFCAAIRRRSDQNLRRLAAALEARPDEPLRVLWEYSQEESSAALTTEFLALGNHRKSIASVIAEVSEEIRRVQLDAVSSRVGAAGATFEGLSAETVLFLVTGVPKLIRLEASVGLSSAHAEVVGTFESVLAAVEPRQSRRRGRRRGSGGG